MFVPKGVPNSTSFSSHIFIVWPSWFMVQLACILNVKGERGPNRCMTKKACFLILGGVVREREAYLGLFYVGKCSRVSKILMMG
jgi:hypothetical protein